MVDIHYGVHVFKKKPVEVQAIQLTWQNWNAVCEFVPKPWFVRGVWLDDDGNILPEGQTNMQPSGNGNMGLLIQTLESQQFLAKGNDWIIRGVNEEFYACKPDIFEKTYEVVEERAKAKAKAKCDRCGGIMYEFTPHVCEKREDECWQQP